MSGYIRGLIRAGQFATRPVAVAIVATSTVAWFMLFPATFGWGAIMILAAWISALALSLVSMQRGQDDDEAGET